MPNSAARKLFLTILIMVVVSGYTVYNHGIIAAVITYFVVGMFSFLVLFASDFFKIQIESKRNTHDY